MSFKVAQATVPPSSLEEVEQLVLRLYSPGGAQHIQQVERQLRDLQHSPEGWKIADFLLHRSTSQVRYFGALTFQINLNTKGATLDDEGLASLGTRLVQGIITELNRGEGPLVLRKLCSTFAVYCVLDRPDHAKFCVKQLVLSLLQGTPVSDADTQSSTYLLSTLASNLNNDQILACLIFLSSLKEESSAKIAGYTAQTTARIIDRMDSNLHDAIAIFSECFSIAGQQRLGQEGTSTRIQAFATYSDWVFFAQKAWQGSEESLGPLRELLGSALTWLPTLSVEDASETIQVFTDLLSSFGMFFRSDHLGTLLQIITSPWGMNQMNAALQDPEDTSSFVALVLAFADVTIEDLVTKPDSPLTTQTMCNLTTCNGIAAVEDKCVVDSLEFWHAYVENVVDSEFEDEGPKPWLGHAQSHIAKACQELWVKIQWPPAELYHSLDQDQQKEFRQFRADVSDLLGSAYPVLRSELSKAIVHGCLDALNRQSWHEVEAFLYSMNAISISEKATEHQILIELFGSDLYAHLQNPNLMVPAHTRRTAVDLLGQYAKFFERQQVYLPPALEFLFASLPNTALAQRSAKSIAALCSSCRSSLTDKLVPFIESYQKFLALPTATQYTKERVLGGVAAIIQAVSGQDKQAEQLSLLLGFVQDDIRVAMNKLSALQFEEAQVEVATAMSCLVGIAKGLEEPTDIPNTNGKRADFWTVGPGSPVQEQICQTVRMAMHIFEKSPMPLELHGDVIESICAVFKSGFSEAVPGPFVLLPRVTVEFFATVSAQTPRLEVILNMLCAYLRSHSTPTSPLINMEVGQLLQRLIIVIKEIQDPRNEAEISSGLIEVLTRFMPKYTDVLLETPGQEDLSYILNFTMECLIVPEYLPKRKAAEFWAVLIALPKTTSTHLDEVITYFGPTLAHNLINQVSGNATRTDLDWFTEPLRSFIKRDVQTKKWIELALTSADFPAPNVTMEARRKFLKALSVGNSLVLTKRVVLGYWNECKGLAGTGYAP
ncbi:ARM repeat-containing protein [Venturia nashicola]|uniref:ARM repeat-containing protein n=1 Tax=Venturia nashicola TaxID=86259 RepID=A0A4Z1NTR6_9PEZI|nr:ARM repeat-containing protein [Venturia nashicola]